jgi:ATP-binding cassette subfamily B protein
MSYSFADRLAELDEFRDLPEEVLKHFESLADLKTCLLSEVIAEKGELLPGIIHILDGSVELLTGRDGDFTTHVDVLHSGAIVADGIFEDSVVMPHRLAVHSDDATIQIIPRHRIVELLTEQPGIRATLNETRRINLNLVRISRVKSLRGIPKDGLRLLARDVREESVGIGSVVIEQGKTEDDLFVVEEGTFFVTRNEAPNDRLATESTGAILGEIAVLTGQPRNANVTAETNAVILRISGAAFREVVEQHNDIKVGLSRMIEKRIDEAEEATRPPDSGDQRGAAADGEREPARRRQKVEEEVIEIERAWWQRKFKPPVILQHSEMDCSAACLSMVCKYYGKTISLNVSREVARVRQEGASMTNVIRAAGDFGFKTEAFISTIEQLREKELPAIANWKGYHWIVVYAVTEDKVTVGDPAQGLVEMTVEEFTENWSLYTIFLEPTRRFEELEESKPSLRAFWSYYEPHKRTIAEIFLVTVFLQLLSVVGPLFSKFVVDEIIMKQDGQWLFAAIALMGGIALLNMIMDFFQDEMSLRLSMNCNLNMVADLYGRMLRLPLSYFERRKIGDITNRLEQHETITDFITEDGLDTFLGLMTAAVYLVVMLYFNVWMTVAAVSLLFANLWVVRFISPRLRQINRESFVKEADMESHTIESIRGAKTLKMIGAEDQARWGYENHFAEVSNLEFKEAKLSQIAEIFSGMVDSLGDVAILFLGGAFVIWGEMSIGELVAFTMFANGIQEPINKLIGKWDELLEVFIAIERMNDVLEKEPEFPEEGTEAEDRIALPFLQGNVAFNNITFRYEPDDQDNVVQAVDLDIKAGSKVAFVGSSGCGKSTLIKLLYGFYQPSSGNIVVDGFDMNDISVPSLRQQIAMVPQSSVIFKGSVRDNIAIARPDATLPEIIDAARLAEADEFVRQMPGGYDAELQEQGSNLSGGQRQRLAIARAFLQRASMLVLDEATSALDVETERVVMENIYSTFADRTVFIIAHRLSSIRKADQIVVLNKGLVVESGSFDDLLAERGFFYALAGMQESLGE